MKTYFTNILTLSCGDWWCEDKRLLIEFKDINLELDFSAAVSELLFDILSLQSSWKRCCKLNAFALSL